MTPTQLADAEKFHDRACQTLPDDAHPTDIREEFITQAEDDGYATVDAMHLWHEYTEG